jgi:hypothetical protein
MGYLLAGALCSSALILKRDDVAFAALSVGMVIGAPDIYWGYMLIPFIGLLPLASHVARGLRSATSGPTYRDRISVPAQ